MYILFLLLRFIDYSKYIFNNHCTVLCLVLVTVSYCALRLKVGGMVTVI